MPFPGAHSACAYACMCIWTQVSGLQRWRGLWSHRDTESQSRSGAALLSPVGHFRLDTPRQPSGNPNVGLKGPPQRP